MKNKKIDIELDLEDLLGLAEPKKGTLDYDLNFIINNGYDEFIKLQEEEKNKDREFLELFKRNYNEIVKIIQFDPKQQIAVNCKGCRYGGRLDVSSQYGRPKETYRNYHK